MSTPQEDPLSLASDEERMTNTSKVERDSRSASPAKRRASAMDESNMDVDKNTGEQPQNTTSSNSSSSKASSKQNTREASVDMLSATNGDSAAISTNASSVSEAPQDQEMKDTIEAPSIDEQVALIMSEQSAELQDGAEGYVVSSAWINRVLARSKDSELHGPFSKETMEGEIGPLDNSAVIPAEVYRTERLSDEKGDPYVPLRAGLLMGTDIELFTKKAFDLAVQWYGLAAGQVPIKRFAHATTPDSVDQNVQYELYPPIFTLRKLSVEKASFDKHATEDNKHRAPRMVASRSMKFQAFLKSCKEATGIAMNSKVKLWRVLNPESVGTDEQVKVGSSTTLLSPPQSREPSPDGRTTSLPLTMKSEAFKAMPEGVEKEMIDMKDETSNEKYNGSAQLETLGLAADQILILEEQSTTGFQSDIGKKATKGGMGATRKKGGLISTASSARSSPLLGPLTRGRNRTSGRTPGSVGLSNLGNTCYMNSALQCIRATEELTCFFLSNQWKKELNKGNALGYEGRMAQTYAQLIDSIFNTNAGSFSPNEFKRTLSRCGPQFSGYGQQDSQEFMSFLVDALHEDMNRIHKKPYIENPDSDDARIHDPEYVKELGDTFRENYRKRNDSVIHDLFNGFYKNTMVCPSCDKVSITFDPYLLLTLQLPLEHSWQHSLTFVPLRGDPIKVDVDMDRTSTVRQLKEYVASKIPGLDAQRLIYIEVFSRKFYRTIDETQTVIEANIQPRDEMYMYELDQVPTNWPPPRKKKKAYKSVSYVNNDDEDDDIPDSDSQMADCMLVPVFQRAPKSPYGSMALTLTPFFITLNRKEASSYQEIYRKLLRQIVNFTTRDILTPDSSDESESGEEQDGPVVTTEEDSSSTIDPDVQARSVESEDGIVDITVKASAGQHNSSASSDVLATGAPIPTPLQNLFKVLVMPKGSSFIPTSYSMDDGRKYASLQSRVPQPPKQRVSPSSLDEETQASMESSDADEIAPSAQTTFNSATAVQASDSEDAVTQKSKKLKTYGKSRSYAGKDSTNADESADLTDDPMTDHEQPLVTLGECLWVEWDSETHDALFGGRDPEDMRGQETISKNMSVLADDELAEKRRQRSERKKNGVSLDDCFRVSAQGEILTEDNAWYCNKCKELRQAKKTLEIWTAPDILVIHLKRFSAARQFRDKIDIVVDFPTEGLSLNDKVGMTEDKDLTYDLFAVDNHYGGLGGGHYTAFAKNFVDEQWYEYNDSSVSKRNAAAVVTSAAYLLFYRRRSAQYLGPPDLSQLVASVRDPEETEEQEGSAAEEEPNSRTASPSGQGKGHRLGGSSFLSGSSSASVAAGAGRLHRRGGDGLGAAQETQAKNVGTLTGLDEYAADDEDDEGIADMDQPAFGPQLPRSINAQQVWSWDNVQRSNVTYEADELASNVAMDDDAMSDKMLEDFGDEADGLNFSSHHQNSPIYPSTEIPHVVDHMQLDESRFEDADEAVEIRLDSPTNNDPHQKTD